MDLASFAFNTSTYFKYNGKLYKWLDGTTLASQVSVFFLVQSALLGWFRGLLFANALIQ